MTVGSRGGSDVSEVGRRSRVRSIAARVVLVAVGIAFALLLTEAALQVGALFVAKAGATSKIGWLTGRRRVLCLGDSNTYGLYVGSAAAYPHQLELLAGEQLEVLNFGFPGYNSSKVRNVLPTLLSELKPDLVTLMIGGNDFWTRPEPVATAHGGSARVGDLLWRVSRTFRLLYMIRRTFDRADLALSAVDGRVVATFGDRALDMGVEPAHGHPPDWPNHLSANLIDSIATIRAAGAQPLLLTYPADHNAYAVANRVLRETAASTGVGLVDISRRFAPRCPGWKCPELLFFDDHPLDEGHKIAADELMNRLVDMGIIQSQGASPQSTPVARAASGPPAD